MKTKTKMKRKKETEKEKQLYLHFTPYKKNNSKCIMNIYTIHLGENIGEKSP